MKIVVFGAGKVGKIILSKKLKPGNEIIAVVDNNPNIPGGIWI